MRLVYIYGLLDPVTENVRYIGLTRQPYTRFFQHLNEAKRNQTRRDRWILKLGRQAQKPLPVIVMVVAECIASQMERLWIHELRDAGCDLLNLTDGGETGFNHSEESRMKYRVNNSIYWQSHPRQKSSDELRKRLSDIQKQRVADGRSNVYALAQARVGKPKPRHIVEKAAAKIRGKPANITEERRSEMRAVMLQRWTDPTYQQKMHESGVRHTAKPEVMAKLGKRPRNKRTES